MSIYIKGTRAPGDCRECQFINYSAISGRTWCGVTGDVLAVDFRSIPFDGISENCPIEEIPPHGRLIDADALKEAILRHLSIKGEENLLPAEKSVFDNIIKAKTIIRAED